MVLEGGEIINLIGDGVFIWKKKITQDVKFFINNFYPLNIKFY